MRMLTIKLGSAELQTVWLNKSKVKCYNYGN